MIIKASKMAEKKFPAGPQLKDLSLNGLTCVELAELYGYLVLTKGHGDDTKAVIDELRRRDKFVSEALVNAGWTQTSQCTFGLHHDEDEIDDYYDELDDPDDDVFYDDELDTYPDI